MCRNTRTPQTCADIQVQRTYIQVEHKQYRNVQKYKNNTEMCRHTSTTEAEIHVQYAQKYDFPVWTFAEIHVNIYRNVSTCTEVQFNHIQKYSYKSFQLLVWTTAGTHLQKCVNMYRNTVESHAEIHVNIYRNVSTYTEIQIHHRQEIQVQYRHLQKY